VRVVVADDVMLTREGIVRLLRDAGIDVVAEAEDAEALLREVRKGKPDVAVVDIKMPPTHTDEGLVAAQAIRADHPETGVLILSQYVEPSYAMRLIQDHPERVGYLLKERVFDIATVVDALRRIMDGETVIDPTIVAASRAGAAGPIPSRPSPTGNEKSWGSSPKACPTAPSPPGCS
jgi:DNA-binding NarL/FixJ family response regulator